MIADRLKTIAVSPETIAERLKTFIRNRQTWGFLVSVAVMAVISLAFFYPDNFDGNSLRQHDMMQGIANGQEIVEYQAATGETSRWTNSLFGGMPTFQISPSYPSDRLFRWFTAVYGLGLPSPSNLLFMMMLGFMILMMAMRIRWEYGLIGAIAWGFSTYFIIIIGAGHIWKFVTLAYIPPTIAGVMMAYSGRRLGGAAMAAFFAMMQIVSNHVQMSYYFFFVILGVAVAFAVTAVKEKKMGDWLKATGALAAAAVLAVAANLPNLYHTYKYSKESQRAPSELVGEASDAPDSTQSKEYITAYSYGRDESFSLFIPNIKGGATMRPVGGRMSPVSLADLDEAKEWKRDPYVDYYLNFSTQYFGEPEGTNGPVYVGVIIFALFILGCVIVKGPLKWALLVLTILSVLLALGRNFMPLTDLFIDFVPLYSKFRTPESILVIAEFTIPLLGVLGLTQLLENPERLKADYRQAMVCFGAVAAACLIVYAFPGVFGDGVSPVHEDRAARSALMSLGQQYSQEEVAQLAQKLDVNSSPTLYNAVSELHLSLVRADAGRSLLFVLAAMLVLTAYAYGKIRSLMAGGALGLLVLIDLYSVNKRYISHDSFSQTGRYALTIQPTDIDREIMKDRDPNYRVLDLDRFADADPSYFHKMVSGYHAAKLRRMQDIIDAGLFADQNVFNMLNARYIVYRGQLIENPEAMGNAWLVDDVEYVDGADSEFKRFVEVDLPTSAVADRRFEPVLGSASPKAEGDTIYETSYAPNRLTYKSHTVGDRVALFSEVYFPWGWKATVDGKPAEIARVNYIVRAMRIPAGDHEITMTFDPDSVHVTSTVATVAVILIYLLVIAAVAGSFLKKDEQPA